MKVIGILLLVAGIVIMALSSMAFGDIGVSMICTGIVSILSGIGFLLAPNKKTVKG